MTILSQEAVRGLMIQAQGLDDVQKNEATKQDVRAMIRQMHLLQIDSINVVARSPYFVLWSRLGYYEPQWLDELLEEGALFEYWSHAACFLPIENYPLYPPLNGMSLRPRQWLDDNPELARKILDHVRLHGETRASDFERTDGQKTGWFNWKEEKIALENLFYVGELMVRKRHNFQRIYDLRERILPDAHRPAYLSLDDVDDAFVTKTVQALGVTKPEWIADYFRLSRAITKKTCQRLEEQGRIIPISVEGWQTPGYVHPETLPHVEKAINGHIPIAKTVLLSPFDPLVWDRQRTLDLFGFDYKIEAYTPAHRRKYGYFTLPVLYKNALIGRIDPKAHRKEGVFEVKAFHLEPHVQITDVLITELKTMLQACARWHQTPTVIVRHATDTRLIQALSDTR